MFSAGRPTSWPPGRKSSEPCSPIPRYLVEVHAWLTRVPHAKIEGVRCAVHRTYSVSRKHFSGCSLWSDRNFRNCDQAKWKSSVAPITLHRFELAKRCLKPLTSMVSLTRSMPKKVSKRRHLAKHVCHVLPPGIGVIAAFTACAQSNSILWRWKSRIRHGTGWLS